MIDAFSARKAIESLRAGVPNLSAVAALRLDNAEIIAAFERNCSLIAGIEQGSVTKRGFFVEGNFGSGKSHSLRYLQTVAAGQNMAFSMVPISKEAPLHDLNAIYRGAIASLNLGPGRLGGSLAGVFEKVDTNGKGFSGLCESLASSRSVGAPLFLASLLIFRRFRSVPETVEQICDFWDGGPAQLGPWRKLLRETDDFALPLKTVPTGELSTERFRFASMALSLGGFNGWYLALDEIELISKFGLRSRAKAYASLSFLFADANSVDDNHRWFPVGAITGDLTSELLDRRDDMGSVKNAFRWEPETLAKAVRGIEILIERGRTFRLREPNVLDLRKAHDNIRSLYEKAYGVSVSDAYSPTGGRLSKSMRQYVREWIAYWDLKMQDDTYEPVIASKAVAYSLAEDSDLESVN